ncbi:unnamed protein product, partial [Ixodes persulcatus]
TQSSQPSSPLSRNSGTGAENTDRLDSDISDRLSSSIASGSEEELLLDKPASTSSGAGGGGGGVTTASRRKRSSTASQLPVNGTALLTHPANDIKVERLSPESDTASPQSSPSPARVFPPGLGFVLGLRPGLVPGHPFPPGVTAAAAAQAAVDRLTLAAPALKQMEMMTRNYSDFMRSLAAKYNNPTGQDGVGISRMDPALLLRAQSHNLTFSKQCTLESESRARQQRGGSCNHRARSEPRGAVYQGGCSGSQASERGDHGVSLAPNALLSPEVQGSAPSALRSRLPPLTSPLSWSITTGTPSAGKNGEASTASYSFSLHERSIRSALLIFLRGRLLRAASARMRSQATHKAGEGRPAENFESAVRPLRTAAPDAVRPGKTSASDSARVSVLFVTSIAASTKQNIYCEPTLFLTGRITPPKNRSRGGAAADIVCVLDAAGSMPMTVIRIAPRGVALWRGTASFVVTCRLCSCVQKFREQSIDGTSLPLLTEDHLTVYMGMRLGPALKLRTSLAKLTGRCTVCMHCIHCHGEDNDRRSSSSASSTPATGGSTGCAPLPASSTPPMVPPAATPPATVSASSPASSK